MFGFAFAAVNRAVKYLAYSLYCISRGVPVYTSLLGGLLIFEIEMREMHAKTLSAGAHRLLGLLERAYTLPVPGGAVFMPQRRLDEVIMNIFQLFVEREYESIPGYLPRNGDVVVDVGSAIGLWALYVSRLVGKHGKVLAVEPNPSTLEELDANMRLNRLENVVIVRNPIGARSGPVDFFTTRSGSGSSSLFQGHVEANAPKGMVMRLKMETTTLDDVLQSNGLQRVDLLKVDCEGSEMLVLRGASTWLAGGLIRRLVIEVHEDVCPPGEVTLFLEARGYLIEKVERYTRPAGQERTLVYARHHEAPLRS